jgi:hypothetical protein
MNMKLKFTKLLLLWLAIAGVLHVVPAAEKRAREIRLSAICRGRGTIESTNYNGKFLVVGRKYTMVAKPSAGYFFRDWTDGYDLVVTNQPRLTFIMKTNSAFVANFVKPTGLPGVLDGVSIAKIPTTVLAAVNAVPAAARGQALAQWMETVAEVQPSALPSVLSTVVTAHPELMAAAISAAVTASPGMIYSLVQAAAQTPAANVSTIVVAACTVLPAQSYQIVRAVLDVDPAAGRTALRAVASAVPELANSFPTGVSGSLSKPAALAILSSALSSINWPVISGPPDVNPRDYSRP